MSPFAATRPSEAARLPAEAAHGRDDPAAPIAAAVRRASRWPNAQAHLFDGEGHFVFHPHADAVVASIREHTSTVNATANV
jgi:pimeloyl-ACP methyl ester carboxylesterase